MQSLFSGQLATIDFSEGTLADTWELPRVQPEHRGPSVLQRALARAEEVIRQQAEHIRQLENLALLDELTGLYNRRGFYLAFQRELARARRDAGARGVVIMVDLDKFKVVNDKYGHNVGDSYLQAAAAALAGCVRASDIVARLGGDEFVLLFPEMTCEEGVQRLATLDKEFNSRFMQTGATSLPLRGSFGMAAYTGTDNPEAVMASADLRLYAHKAGRNS